MQCVEIQLGRKREIHRWTIGLGIVTNVNGMDMDTT